MTALLPTRHLLGIDGLQPEVLTALMDRADKYWHRNRGTDKKGTELKGRTQINLFYESSTRTLASFELAGKRLGADVVNFTVTRSAVTKGESLLDTAATLDAMAPDMIVIRHPSAGAPHLLADHVRCAVVNAGDGTHEHPTQALLDAVTLRRRFGRLQGLTVAICGDIAHSRVARSNILMLSAMGARLRLIGPPTLLPADAERLGVEVYTDLESGIAGCDAVMALRLQKERMTGPFIPSEREYFARYGLTRARLANAKPGAVVMHPGPINRGIEIDGALADDPEVSLITDQVETGLAVRMAVLDTVAERLATERHNTPDEAVIIPHRQVLG